MKEIIQQKIDLIADCIFEKIKKTDENEKKSYGLYTGDYGVLLFLLYYSRYKKNENYAALSEKYAERLLNQLIMVKSHTFCKGFSGILYLFEWMKENDIIYFDTVDVQSSLDKFLIKHMMKNLNQKNHDFLHGALGVGLYFVKKASNIDSIQKLIDFLYKESEKDLENQIFKWESEIEIETKNIQVYNLSISHGISSIIIFLSRLIKIGMCDVKILKMLTASVNYVLSQKIDYTKFGSFFPNFIIISSPQSISQSRLAWCYGDLGIGIAIWQAGNVVDNKEWKEKGLEVLLQSTKRRTFTESLVRDAGICHGSAGIAMIYRRMYLETKNEEFKEASQFWINQTLNYSSFEDGVAGYKFFLQNKLDCDYSFLMGISGIGLVLISFLTEDMQTWDEMLLLS